MPWHYFSARVVMALLSINNMNISSTRKERLQKLLKAHRIQCGTLKELAKRIGIKPGTLSTYIQGDSYPDTGNLAKIAAYINLTVDGLEKQLDNPDAEQKMQIQGDSILYSIESLKAEQFFPMLVQLPSEEKIALARHLLNAAL
jgi:transcriptional regulator with XRE-family HTH domain